SELYAMWNIDNGKFDGEDATYVGREVILTQYGYVNAAKYTATISGATMYVYADASSGAALAISAHLEYATTAGTIHVYIGSCIVSSSFTAS
ncbi:MAG: hypothetical protein Q4Q62_08810, partial [Thermoplasmata archaeon]|nr:hypothetical protein [Thermoplasmata archaeon]